MMRILILKYFEWYYYGQHFVVWGIEYVHRWDCIHVPFRITLCNMWHVYNTFHASHLIDNVDLVVYNTKESMWNPWIRSFDSFDANPSSMIFLMWSHRWYWPCKLVRQSSQIKYVCIDDVIEQPMKAMYLLMCVGVWGSDEKWTWTLWENLELKHLSRIFEYGIKILDFWWLWDDNDIRECHARLFKTYIVVYPNHTNLHFLSIFIFFVKIGVTNSLTFSFLF